MALAGYLCPSRLQHNVVVGSYLSIGNLVSHLNLAQYDTKMSQHVGDENEAPPVAWNPLGEGQIFLEVEGGCIMNRDRLLI